VRHQLLKGGRVDARSVQRGDEYGASLVVVRAFEVEDVSGTTDDGGIERPLPVGAHDDDHWETLAGKAVNAGQQSVDASTVLVVHLFRGSRLRQSVGLVHNWKPRTSWPSSQSRNGRTMPS